MRFARRSRHPARPTRPQPFRMPRPASPLPERASRRAWRRSASSPIVPRPPTRTCCTDLPRSVSWPRT
ncbi:MAG TPA: hypothetical protein EYQ54_13055 [Myxococcales bacterium]|nr:hypothetical protein [Myxococcales bacterium]HIL80748.1 hypothetical protein [Myxococcales bacterium]